MKPKHIRACDINSLWGQHVRIKDTNHLEMLINQLVDGGREKLQIISDFDMTLTKQHINGKRCLSSFGIFGECSQLPVSYKERSTALFNEYRPIEINSKLTKAEKTPYMVEWYQKAEVLLKGFPFQLSELDEVVQQVAVELRDGTDTVFAALRDAQVPVLVFSAGLGDMVTAVLRHYNVIHENVHIISNYLQFSGTELSGFQGNVIHSLNKNEHALEGTDYAKQLEGRSNVILMGDAVGDSEMAEGVPNVQAVLKIGYLYDKVEECLDLYLDHFDIVLIDDQTMNVFQEILQLILDRTA